jgi:hypothetical protein
MGYRRHGEEISFSEASHQYHHFGISSLYFPCRDVKVKSLVRLLTNDLVRCVGPKHGHGSRSLCTCISMSKMVL